MRFDIFSNEEKKMFILGLIKECESFIKYGLDGYNEDGKRSYNRALSLLKEADSEKEYEYIYKDWKPVEIK
jgi:hypothetical protein